MVVLRGDLADASPADLITSLADQQATGCLAIDRATRAPAHGSADDGQATLHLRNGEVYAAALNGGTFLVGTRLVASHALAAPALAEALEAQRTDLTGWRLGEILVHLGHVHADVVEKISLEQVLEIAGEVFGWRSGSWKFRSGERTRAMLPHPLTATDLVQRVQARAAEWRELQPATGGRHAPVIRTAATVPLEASRELVALLRAADEQPDDAGVEACSRAAGFSLLEGARLVVSARAAGLLVPVPVEERMAVGDWSAAGGQAQTQSRMSTATAPPAGLSLAPPLVRAPSPRGSYALARLMELEGPAAATAPVSEPAASPVVDEAAPDELSPEEIAADLAPEPVEETGQDATVLDLAAARAAKSAELAAVEEAATAAALADQLAREQSERDSEERAVADALRQAAEARAAADAAERRQRVAAAIDAAVLEDPRPAAFVTPAAAFVTGEQSSPMTAGERLGMFSASRDPLADTASLLRELSSLGDDEEPPAEPRSSARPQAAPTPSAPAKTQPDKKRKGLFGR